jgi:hypothetical protein
LKALLYDNWISNSINDTELLHNMLVAVVICSAQRWETEAMSIDKKIEKEIKEGRIPKPIEDLPSEWEKEDREIGGAKPDLEELEEDPSEL